MDNRIPGYVTGITEMYQRKNAHSYSQQPRTGRLIPPNYRHRRKRSKDHRYRREIELEEDIVKTGSEDETEVRYKRRLRRRRDERGKRNEVTYTALNRDKQFWKSQLARERNDFLMKNRNDSVGPLRVERNTGTKSQSSVSNTPKVTYNGPMPHLSDGYGAVPIRNPGRQDSVSTNRNMEAEFGVVPNIVKTPAYGKQRTRTIVSDNHSHLMVQNGPHETYKVDNSDHKNARSKRASVLNRAEKLLHVRKLREETSSGEEGDTEKSDEPLAQRKVEYPSSDDDKYVVVKTTVSPTDSDLYTDLDVPLPPLPRNDVYPSRNSGKSIPSMTRVSNRYLFFSIIYLFREKK